MVSISEKTAPPNASIEEMEFDAAEAEELDKLAERIHK
jgi:hypothetical protein